MKKIAVLYHANCPDGFGGAWAAWKKFGNKAEYYPVRYNSPPPEIKNKDLFMIDFCYEETEFLKELLDNNKSLTIIDHHISSKKNINMATRGILEMDNSGAVLAWKYFHPSKPTPLFLRHLEDIDLWRFKIKGTKEIAAYIDLLPQEFKKWDDFIGKFENAKFRKNYLEQGALILKHNDMLIRKVIDKAGELVKFEDHEVYAINMPLLESELGAVLYKEKPPMSIMWYANKDGIKVSLRSNGSVDVSKIAAKFGGGGHKSSSGFRLPKGAKLPWKPINKKYAK